MTGSFFFKGTDTVDPIHIRYLSGHDVAELDLGNDEILDAIESSLRAQGQGETVIEPRMHLVPNGFDEADFTGGYSRF